MKKKMEINQLEEINDDAFEVFMINPTKIDAGLRESMFHLNYKMHQSIDLSMDLEIKVEGFCSMNCTNI